MILDATISAIFTTIQFIFGVFPSLPAIPPSFETATDFAVTQINNVASIFATVYSPVLFSAIVGSLIVLLAFESIYHVTMWVLRKIPLPIH